MFKNKIWLGIILSIFILVFSINGFASYYKYTQESGSGFFVGSPDKADALEDTNEVRQIIDDLGNLLDHSKRDDSYPEDETTGGTLAIPNSALVSFATGTKGDLFYCSAENTWIKLNIGSDNQILVVATDLPNWETPSSDLLSDVASIAMLDENEDITGAWTISTGSIAGVDTTEFGYLNGVTSDIQTQFGLRYLKTEVNTLGKVEAIYTKDIIDSDELAALKFTDLADTPASYDNGKYAKSTVDGLVWDIPSGGYTNLTSFVDQTAWRLFYSNNLGDVIELALGTDGQYLKSTGATSAPIFDDPAGAGDMLKATYDIDEDGDIDVAAGGTEKSVWTLYAIPYLSGTTTFGEITIGTAEYCLTVNAGATGYDFTELAYNSLAGNPSDRITAGDKLTWDVDTLNVIETDPTVDTDAEIKAILVDEVIKTGDFTAGRIAKINNATGIIEQGTNTDTDVADSVTKKHSQNTDTDLDATFEATFVKKTDTVNVLSDITSAGANIEDAVTKKHTQNTDTQFDFYNALGSDHLYSGDKDTQLVGESVVFGDLLYFNWTDKEWKKAKADASTTVPGSRIALESKADGQTCLMLVKGYIRDDSAFNFAGAMVYVSAATAGAMTSTAPSTAGNQLQRVGQAKSADILFFDPSIDVGEI